MGGIPQKRTEKYVIKIINFVAIKVLVIVVMGMVMITMLKVLVEEEEEVYTEEEVEEIQLRRARSQRKVSINFYTGVLCAFGNQTHVYI